MNVRISSVLTGFFGLTMVLSFSVFISLLVLSLRTDAITDLDDKFQSVLNLNEKILLKTMARSQSLTTSLSETFMTIKAFMDFKTTFKNKKKLQNIYQSAEKDRSSILMRDGTETYEFMHEAHHLQIGKYLKTSFFSDIIFLSADGQVIYTYQKRKLFGENINKLPQKYKKAQFLKKLVTTLNIDQPVNSAIFRQSNLKASYFSASPLYVADRITGYVITETPFNHIGNLLNDVGSLGKTGTIILTDLKGKLLTWKSSEIPQVENWKLPKELLDNKVAFSHKSLTIKTNGRSYKSVLRRIHASNQKFLLILQQAEEEIFKHSKALQFELVIGGIVILFLALLSIIFISRYVSRPLAIVTNELHKVASGNMIDITKFKSHFYEIQEVSEALETFHSSVMERQKLERNLVDRSLEMEMMNVEMKHANEELEQYRAHLEDLVHDRTKVIEQQASQLEEALEAEKELNNLQRSFVSMASHEFRTPLAIIDAVTQKFIRRPERISPEKLIEYANKIRSAVARMTSLMESTLNAARMENGKIQINIEECNIKKLLTENCKNQQELSSKHNIKLDFGNAPETIMADTSALGQVMTNLLSNAVKYSPDNPDIDVTIKTDDNHIHISVSDHGLGIDDDELPQMFTRFFRAKTSTGIAGTGIGLNLSKILVEEHGGEIKLTSQKGIGSTFTVCLPLIKPEE